MSRRGEHPAIRSVRELGWNGYWDGGNKREAAEAKVQSREREECAEEAGSRLDFI